MEDLLTSDRHNIGLSLISTHRTKGRKLVVCWTGLEKCEQFDRLGSVIDLTHAQRHIDVEEGQAKRVWSNFPAEFWSRWWCSNVTKKKTRKVGASIFNTSSFSKLNTRSVWVQPQEIIVLVLNYNAAYSVCYGDGVIDLLPNSNNGPASQSHSGAFVVWQRTPMSFHLIKFSQFTPTGVIFRGESPQSLFWLLYFHNS